jgi:hypothetical protein
MMSAPNQRRWYWILLGISLLGAGAVVVWGGRLRTASHFLSGTSIRLYLLQLRNSIIALPFFLIWLRQSRRPAASRVLQGLNRWWFTSRRTVPIALAGFGILAITVARVGYHGIPLADAVFCWFQTRIFAHGHLYAPAPRYPEFFATRTVFHDGKWFSLVPPGHPLVLLLGYPFGLDWLIGPALGIGAVALIYRLVRQSFGFRTARIALLLAASSPFMIFLFASEEFHVTSLFFTILALLAVSRPRMGVGAGLGAGFSLGMVFLTRPYTAVGIGLPVVLYVVVRQRRALIPMLASGAAMVALHLGYNRILTGGYLTFPYQLAGNRGIGFGADYGESSFGLHGHSPLRALINLGYAGFALALQLFGWLFLSLAYFVPGWLSARFRRNWWLWAPGLALVIAYLAYWFHGVTPWGPKYWSEALPTFIVLSAVGVRAAPRLLRRWLGVRRDFVLRANAFLFVFSLLVFVPTALLYFATYRWGETPKVAQQVAARGLHNALVFVHTDENSGSFDYTSAFIFDDPFLHGDVIYAQDLGSDEDQKLVELYPDRAVYRYDFNRNTIEPIPRRVQPVPDPGRR